MKMKDMGNYEIQGVENGFILTPKSGAYLPNTTTSGIRVFESFETLTQFLKDHFIAEDEE